MLLPMLSEPSICAHMDTATGDIMFHMVLMCRNDHLGIKMVVGHRLHQLKEKQI